MDRILGEPIQQYLLAKQTPFANNPLANKFRHDFPNLLSDIIPDKERYFVKGSPGQGGWTDNPWLAILDRLVTETPQSGYYPVFLFKKDMSGVYLSLNQGVTEVRENYRRDTKNVLQLRAQDFRAKLDFDDTELTEIDLNSTTPNARLYEAGNIIAKYYSANNLPNQETITQDVLQYLGFYEELTYNDLQIDENKEHTAIEKKKIRMHFRIDRNTSISKKVKDSKGYVCEACNFDFVDKYGELGRNFIEAHHLIPIANLNIGQFRVNIQTDFSVLCSNCHSMIHRLEDPSDLEQLRQILRQNE